ncbi:MAG: hypothetical protein A3G41_08515 [Elusimicrobia bacterium RIFCSPLOWO2_12_FULL_59_9]|nr:MAG: hypothetical protein A3G41_08515 [Elusimicrobia bacterium RIFCSPLOWO2_12_FULL_59_9]
MAKSGRLTQRPVPGFLSDQDIQWCIQNGEIAIAPFSNDQLTSVGYNLSFTWFIFSVNSQELCRIHRESGQLYCFVEPNDTVLVLTREAVWVCEDIAGAFHSKVGIVSKGFGHISTTLDPNWEGPLLISLNNPTRKRLRLTIAKDSNSGIRFETFATLIFFRMASPTTLAQDNLQSRIEILREIGEGLANSRKSAGLVRIIQKIRDQESPRVNVSAAPVAQRGERLEQFRDRYDRLAKDMNGYIADVVRAGNMATLENRAKYVGVLLAVVGLNGGILWLAIQAYVTNNSNMLALLAMIFAFSLYLLELFEKVSRKKWL